MSINSRTFFSLLLIFVFNYYKYSLYISLVIYFDLLNLYIIRRLLWLIRVKHCGFSNLLITQGLNFSEPSALLVNTIIIWSLLFLVLLRDFVARVQLGVLFQFKLVLSILRILHSSYSLQSCCTNSICMILLGWLV